MAAVPPSSTRWLPNQAVVWTLYQDSEDAVACNTLSGDVHLVTASAHTLWRLVAEGAPQTSVQLVADLASALGRTANSELRDATLSVLEFMDRAGLIRPASE
jgi:hypothetical protein